MPKATIRTKWLSVPTYAEVTYDDVYPGIGLVYHGRNGSSNTTSSSRPAPIRG